LKGDESMANMSGSPFWAVNIVRNCMAIQPGERVMLVTDAGLSYVHQALKAEIGAIGPEELWEYVVRDDQRPLTRLPKEWLEHIDTFDVGIEFFATVHIPDEHSSRTQRVERLVGKSIRYAWGAHIDEGILENELSADYEEIGSLTRRLAERMRGSKAVHITGPSGTDLRMSIEGRRVLLDTGQFHQPGTFGNLPAGECYVSPLEESADGVLVVDKSFPGLLVKNPVYMTFKRGRVVEIAGGEEARWLENVIAEGETKPNGENCRTIGELAVGTNEKARLTGNLMTDEKVLGTIHVAIGNNTGTYGGNNPAPIHIDGVVGDATLAVDGQILLDRGKLQI
jgi:leucyl aminopeptidase (aminopeptidase T)